MNRQMRVFVVGCAACVLLALGKNSAGASERLVIISPHWEGVRIEVTRAFTRWYRQTYGTDVSVEWIDQGGTSDDVRYVISLFAKNPEGIGIDLFFGGGLDPFLKLKAMGYLVPYRVRREILKGIPPSCGGIPNYDHDYCWYGVVLSSFGILYNKKALSFLNLPVPQSWEDLGKECYFSWVGAGDPRNSGTMHMMFEIILQAQGWEKGWRTILSLAGNTKSFSASASQVARDTATGEVAVSLAIDSYALDQIQTNGSENMGFVLPQGMTVINPDAIGILKGAPNLTTAQRFVEFVLSPAMQNLWMVPKGTPGGPKEFSLNRLAIRQDAYQTPGIVFRDLNPYAFSSSFAFDANLSAARWAVFNDMVGACVIDCHRELKQAYAALRGKKDRRLRERFFELPFDATLQKHYRDNWSDAGFRNRAIAQWQNFSRRKFLSVVRQAKFSL